MVSDAALAIDPLTVDEVSDRMALSVGAFEEALVGGDRATCVAMVGALLAQGCAPIDLYEDYFRPALYRIGALWESNRLSVAHEHRATAMVEELMNEVFPRLMSLDRTGKTVVIAPVEGALHQVGSRMVCDVFEMYGWDAVQMGPDTTVDMLVGTLRTCRPALVGLSLTLDVHLSGLRRAIIAIRSAFPLLPILVGGRALGRVRPPALEGFPGVHCFRDLNELQRYIEGLRVLRRA